jgi:RNA polymerase sigma factor (TIGR02999 family)
MAANPGRISELLNLVKSGNVEAEAELAPLIYQELRRLARAHLRGERRDHTLQTTALLHETYLRMMSGESLNVRDRTHFLAIAAGVMRRILIDYARGRKSIKRGGEQQRADLTDAICLASRQSWDKIIDVNGALDRLSEIDARQARIVELRFFGGLEIEEIAEVVGVSSRTVKRDWQFAQSWLYEQLAPAYAPPHQSNKVP